MTHCADCGAWGEHECAGRDPRLNRFIDPEDAREFVARQGSYLDSLRQRLITMRHGSDADVSGICLRCGRPIDDHRLTWALDWYPSKLCPHGKVKDIPIPAVFDEPDDSMLI